MNSQERLRAEAHMRRFQEEQAAAQKEREAAIDLDELTRQFAGRVRPGPHNVAAVLALPDEQLREYHVHVTPSTPGGPLPSWQSFTSGQDRSLTVTGPGEETPSDAVHTQSLAELRHEALASRARARAITASRMPQGIPVNVWGRATRR